MKIDLALAVQWTELLRTKFLGNGGHISGMTCDDAFKVPFQDTLSCCHCYFYM